MAHDKITVDEPLISTDVDSLIRTIAERKRVPLNELRQLCKIDKKTMDKWIAVLEDEGYITVEYGLRGTSVLWRDLEDMPKEESEHRLEMAKGQIQTETTPSEPEQQEPAQAVAPAPQERSEKAETASAVEGADEANADYPVVQPVEDEPAPEELLSEYLAKKRSGGADIDSIKSSILTSLEGGERDSRARKGKEESAEEKLIFGGSDDAPADEEPQEEARPAEAEGSAAVVVEEAPEAAEEPEEAEAEEEAAEEGAEETAESEEQPMFRRETQTLKPTSKERVVTADVRELMNSYLTEINKEKAKVESLKKERESLYREKFATMEGKMQADIVVFTEKIIEKESKIAELKERVLELPDKVEELGRLQEQMELLKKEGREALQRTRAKADEFLVGVGESKAQVEDKISKVGAVLDTQESRLKELEKLGLTLDARSEKLKAGLENAKAQLEELDSVMSSLVSDLQTVEQMKLEAVTLTESIKQTVAAHGEELQSLEQELEGIERTEHWVQEYIRDYEQKIDDIEQYVSRSEDEMVALRESAEALYMKKYLGELESMTDAYQDELHGAVSREKEIEMKISESRSRITELVSESQEMIKKLRSDTPETSEKDFGVLVAKVKARTQRTKNIVEEKQQERAKLIDDSRKTRKTEKPAGASKGKAAAKKAPAKSVAKKRK